ncbi:MAG: DNA-processing protein DprA [Chitinophagaceae bacterium]|nr:DNA-processing protein DprA [Chitinophagaceae bacterium]
MAEEQDELLYQIALTRIPGIGGVYARQLVNIFGSASAVLKAPKKDLLGIEGIGEIRMKALLKPDYKAAEKEITFIEENDIKPLFFKDKGYPSRLHHCYDSPILLYYKGSANLNHDKIVGIVGTRTPTDYGRQECQKIVEGFAGENILIVSGLAFGIDSIAHKSALKNDLETVGVLAHGLDKIYPAENRELSKKMTQKGGLLTEFSSETIPDRMNFPSRNRIVAGMCDCIIVIESARKGGSLITAGLANDYNRDVFALPGRSTDPKSDGCNLLIKSNKAALISGAEDVLRNMGWEKTSKKRTGRQRLIFPDLNPEEKIIVDLLQNEGPQNIDDLHLKTKLNGGAIAQALLMLEMQGLINSLPGKIYELN